MVEEKIKTPKVKKEKKVEEIKPVESPKTEAKSEEVTRAGVSPAGVMSDDKNGQKTETPKVKEKVEAKKPVVKIEKVKKELAVANAYAIPVSTKNSVAICRFIRTKTVDRAIEMMQLVIKKKMAVPMVSDEIPHRKRSLMPEKFGGAGRFPKNAAVEFINLLGQLKANCEVNGVENPVITLAVANLASRPFRREGRRAKRTHVHLEAKDMTKLITNKRVKRLTPRRMM